MRLELTEQERAVLEEVLESWLSDLSVEIADTDRKDFRDGLKATRATIEAVLARLGKSG